MNAQEENTIMRKLTTRCAYLTYTEEGKKKNMSIRQINTHQINMQNKHARKKKKNTKHKHPNHRISFTADRHEVTQHLCHPHPQLALPAPSPPVSQFLSHPRPLKYGKHQKSCARRLRTLHSPLTPA